MDDTLKIKTRICFKHAFKHNLYIAFNNIINYIFLIIAVIGIAMFTYNMSAMDGGWDVRFSKSFIFLIPPFLFIINVPLKIWKVTAGLMSNPVLKEDVIYVFSKDKITFETTKGEASTKWDDYIKVIETKESFRFFMDKVQAQIIPKDQMSDKEIDKLRYLIKESMDPNKIKLKQV